MADISEAELTTIENALESIIQALAADESPAASQLKQTAVEAQQIVSGKLDNGGEGSADATTTDENLSKSMQMPSMH